MPLDSSHYSAGDLVQVRSREEILRTLDAEGCLDGLPFMPEMLRHCDRTFRVAKRAHKTCDFVNKTGVRALPSAVHLENLRCDGCAHGGCQSKCMFFWKDAWLRPLAGAEAAPAADARGCTSEQLASATRAPGTAANDPDPVFACQATRLPDFTAPLSPWNPLQYVEDYRSGNEPRLTSFVSRGAYRALDGLVNLGIGLGRPLRWMYDLGRALTGRPHLYPGTPGRVPAGTKTPVHGLGLEPGERVRVKDHAAILATVDANGRNRGLSFSAEMVPYCGGTYRVLDRVDRIIDERTGRMLRMKQPCIILDQVVCRGRHNKGMLFCPRATYSYWREIWLERIGPDPAVAVAAAATPPALLSAALSQPEFSP